MDRNEATVWLNFLRHEKLDPERTDPKSAERLKELATRLGAGGGCKTFLGYGYADRIKCRRIVCETAIDMGFDLMSVKHKGKPKPLIGRGLLDVWNVVYKERFGGVIGTGGWFEDKRRKVSSTYKQEKKS